MSKLLSDYINKGIVPKVRGPTVDGRTYFPKQESESSDSSSEDENQTDYASEFVNKEMKVYAETFQGDADDCEGLSVDDIVGDLAATELRSEVYRMAHAPEVFRKYNFEFTVPNKELTIHNFKNKILNVMKTNAVLVIHGPTGCGKTTQVPQYIMDDCRLNEKDCRIVVTQPRKIAAINVAKRVCQERGWSVGTVCGYQIGLDKQIGPDVILSYVTTGVLLQKLIHTKSLSHYTHIIIDEVHERNQDMDFLLLVIRKLLFTKSFDTKVILMSATIEANEFAHYFRNQYKGNVMEAPIVHITESNKFVVTNYYLENLPKPVPAPNFDKNKPELNEGVLNMFLFLMNVFDKLDETKDPKDIDSLGSVLVFLPGIREIEDVEKLLQGKQNSDEAYCMKWQIIPLHSSLPNDEQARAFKPVEPPMRKLILSTNIAESSITVPDISYVVDFCLTKNLVVDSVTKFQSLQLEWASHVNCDQRAGRAGRVANGRVYRLVPKEFYENELDSKGVPEILRAPLENLVLHTKVLAFTEEPKALLALAINPPNLSNIETTIWHLKEIGGLLQTCRGRKNISDGDLTFLGTVMSSLPLDVCLSKLIVLGHMFSVLNESIIMATGCSIQNIFATPYSQRFQAYNKKLVWADGSCSDLMALLNLYKVWQACRRDGAFKKPHEEYSWCKANLVNLKGLREWHLMITEIKARLKRFGIEETSGPSRVNLTFQERSTMLKVIICGAFYPNYFTRSAAHGRVDEKEAVRTLGGRDPYKTVYMSNMDPGQPAVLYAKEIKKMLDLPDETKVEMDGTHKVYLEFKNYREIETVNVDGQQFLTTIPGKIAMPVYQAVKRRHHLDYKLDILPSTLAWEHVHNLEQKALSEAAQSSASSTVDESESEDINCYTEVAYDPFPTLDTEYITVVISSRIDAGHFYCQRIDEITHNYLDLINTRINSTPLNRIDVKNFHADKVYACKYNADGQYYRAKVYHRSSNVDVQVLFIDYGNIQNITINELCDLPPYPTMSIAPLAFECVLSEVEPSYHLHRRGIWSERVNEIFDKQTANTILYAKIYSVCDDVVHLELYKNLPNQREHNQPMSLNQWLINQGHARRIEESFISKEDHSMRTYVMTSGNPPGEAKKLLDIKKKEKKSLSINQASMKGVERHLKPILLKGPFSPLEIKYFGILAHGSNKSIDVDSTSVNAVLLDSDPLDPHTRLLVAATINQSPTGGRLILRQTTIMPNIPGFPFLMALIFCPEMEPILNDTATRVASLLCGLGVYDNSIRACFPAHDIVLTADVDINLDIIEAVNAVRYAMNKTLDNMKEISSMRDFNNADDRTPPIEPDQRCIKQTLLKLLRIKMNSIEPSFSKNANVWKNYPLDMERMLPPTVEKTNLWPLHWFFSIQKIDEKQAKLKQNNTTLVRMAKKLEPFEPIDCVICDKYFVTLGSMRMHLVSKEHKENEANANIVQSV